MVGDRESDADFKKYRSEVFGMQTNSTFQNKFRANTKETSFILCNLDEQGVLALIRGNFLYAPTAFKHSLIDLTIKASDLQMTTTTQ